MKLYTVNETDRIRSFGSVEGDGDPPVAHSTNQNGRAREERFSASHIDGTEHTGKEEGENETEERNLCFADRVPAEAIAIEEKQEEQEEGHAESCEKRSTSRHVKQCSSLRFEHPFPSLLYLIQKLYHLVPEVARRAQLMLLRTPRLLS